LLVVCGAVVALTLFRMCGDRRRLLLKQTWSAALLDALGDRGRSRPDARRTRCLLVANHISWIDIFVINAVMPSAFVSKEVRHWPIIGWLAAKNDCLPAPGQPGTPGSSTSRLPPFSARASMLLFSGRNDDRWLQPAAFSRRVVATGAGGRAAGVAGGNFLWELDGQRSLAPRYDGDISLGNARAPYSDASA
jgi:1-acyl-sn-glycerol-3-phosphate acyltransferase